MDISLSLSGLFYEIGVKKKHIATPVKKKHLTGVGFSCMLSKVIEMEKIVEQAFLYDFYGELLTEHQKQVYEDFVLNDLSLSEIAEERRISRQGVHDLVKRCNKILEGYEEKLHLVEKFLHTRENIHRIQELAECYDSSDSAKEQIIIEINRISSELLRDL